MCPGPNDFCSSTDCSLSLYVGFIGEDRYAVTFNTGSELSRLNQYSVTSLFDNTKQQVRERSPWILRTSKASTSCPSLCVSTS